MRNSIHSRVWVVMVAIVMLSLGSAMAAASTWNGASSTDWNDPGNWSDGVPHATLDANFPGGSICVITNAATCSRIRCGSGGTAADLSLTIQDSGKLNILGWPWFGLDAAGAGYTLTVNQNNPGFTNTYSGDPRLVYTAGYHVLYNLQGGTLVYSTTLRVAGTGSAEMHVSGGTLLGSGNLNLADSAGADGTLRISGGSVNLGASVLDADMAGATQTVHIVGADASGITFSEIKANNGNGTFKFELENKYGNSGTNNITPIHALTDPVNMLNAQVQIITGTDFECAIGDTFDLVIQDDGTDTFTAPNLTPDLSLSPDHVFTLAVVEGASDILRATCTWAPPKATVIILR